MCYNKNYQHKFDERLKERFFITFKFFNHANNKVIISFQKGVYHYDEYMDEDNGISLTEKEDFYSHWNMA